MRDLQKHTRDDPELVSYKDLDPSNTTTTNGSNKGHYLPVLSDGTLASASHQNQSYTCDKNAGCQNKFEDLSVSEVECRNVEVSKTEEVFNTNENGFSDETSSNINFGNTPGYEKICVKNDSNRISEAEKLKEIPKNIEENVTDEDKHIKSVPSQNVFDNAAFQDDTGYDPDNGTTENSVSNLRTQSNISDPEVRIDDTYATQRSEVSKLPLFLKTALTIGSCFLATLPFGYLIGLGVVFVEIIDEFKSTRAEAFPIISVYTGIMLGGGAILGPFLGRYNGGKIMILGAIGTFIGCVMCYFAPSIIVLVIGQVFTGFGLSLTFLLPFTVVGEIFEEKRITMVTVVSIFIGVGNVYFPLLMSVLNDEFGWRGTFLILGAFFLNCVPVGILIMIFRKRRDRLVGSQKTDLRSMLNCNVCKTPAFFVLCLNTFIMNTLFTTLNTFFVDMMRSRQFDVRNGPFLLSFNGFASIGGRVLLSVISPFFKCKLMTVWPVFLSLCSITVLTFAYFETYIQLLVICILYGFFWGSCAVLYPAVVMEVSGLKMYATTLGYINFTGGVAGLVGGPLAGAIKDATQSYNMVYYLSTGLGLLSCVLIILVTLLRKSQERTASNGTD